jgi:hypothetical protein
MIEYKYNEDEFIENLLEHVNSTYSTHYAGTIQPVEFIMSNAETLDYLKGNIIKYIHRYGKKDGHNSKDLYKAIHFIMMMDMYAQSKQAKKTD